MGSAVPWHVLLGAEHRVASPRASPAAGKPLLEKNRNFGHCLAAGLRHTWLLQELGAGREQPRLSWAMDAQGPVLGAARAHRALSAAAACCGFVASHKPSLGRGTELPSLSFLPSRNATCSASGGSKQAGAGQVRALLRLHRWPRCSHCGPSVRRTNTGVPRSSCFPCF